MRRNARIRRSPPCLVVAAALVTAGLLLPAAAPAQTPGFSTGYRFTEHSGAELYANVCQACHMPDGKGATGAATYPALAGDGNLVAGGYAVHVVVHGLRGMPPLGNLMTDEQVAAVVNYVRTHFGNSYGDTVSTDDVKAARQ